MSTNQVHRWLFVLFVCSLFLYLFNFKERVAHKPDFITGALVDYSCWKGRSKGRLDLVIESEGVKKKIITSLFGYTPSGWIQCEDLELSKYVGEVVVFGETGVSWDYLKIGEVEIHSLEALKKQINSNTSTVWEADINWKQVNIPK